MRRALMPAVALCLFVLALPGVASAVGPSPLSPRLQSLVAPGVRSLSLERQSERVGLAPNGAGSLLRRGARAIVDVHFADGTAALGVGALKAAGASIVAVSPRYETVSVAALPRQFESIAAVPGVQAVSEEIEPITAGICPSGEIVSEGDGQLEAANARSNFGVDGTGVTVGILSDSFDQWTEAPTHAAEDALSGDLPGPGNPCGKPRPVGVLSPYIPGAAEAEEGEPENVTPFEPTDEGRGMAQIVHDLAPGANIDFASAFNGEFAFANAIRALRAAGASVIADDVVYFDEPFFQDGPVAVAVNEVTASGASYFSSAGNENLFSEGGVGNKGEDEIASWEAPAYRSMACPKAVPNYYKSCMNFSPQAGEEDNEFEIAAEEPPLFIDLQWAQPWHGVSSDFDMYLLSKDGKEIIQPAYNNANTEPGRQEPYEFVPYEPLEEEGEEPEEEGEEEELEEFQLVIARCNLACGVERAKKLKDKDGIKYLAGTKGGDEGTPRLKFGLFGPVVETEYTKSEGGDVVGPTVFGHTAAASAVSVAAINYETKTKPEYYSSRGPTTHYFGPVLSDTPAAPIGTQVIPKPNLTATDCERTSFFYPSETRVGVYRFCGTSAAAPHAAAVAALIRSANPGATNVQVRAALESTALPVGAFGPNAIGAGLVDANRAVAALALPPVLTVTRAPKPLSREKLPEITFAANRPVSFRCSLDGAAPVACTSPFAPPEELGEGRHTFVVAGTDLAGRSASAAPLSFRVDSVAPKVRFAKHPKKLVKTRKRAVKLKFRFAPSEPGATLRCRVDRGKTRKCGKKLVRRYKLGRHVVVVRGYDAAGNVGTPARFGFRVARAR